MILRNHLQGGGKPRPYHRRLGIPFVYGRGDPPEIGGQIVCLDGAYIVLSQESLGGDPPEIGGRIVCLDGAYIVL